MTEVFEWINLRSDMDLLEVYDFTLAALKDRGLVKTKEVITEEGEDGEELEFMSSIH